MIISADVHESLNVVAQCSFITFSVLLLHRGSSEGTQHYTPATQLLMLFPPLLQRAPNSAQCCLSDILLLLTHTCLVLYVSLTQIWSTGKIPNICQNLGGGILVWAGDVLHTWKLSDFTFFNENRQHKGRCSSLQIRFKRAHLVFCLLPLLGNIQQELLYTCNCYQELPVLWSVKEQS